MLRCVEIFYTTRESGKRFQVLCVRYGSMLYSIIFTWKEIRSYYIKVLWIFLMGNDLSSSEKFMGFEKHWGFWSWTALRLYLYNTLSVRCYSYVDHISGESEMWDLNQLYYWWNNFLKMSKIQLILPTKSFTHFYGSFGKDFWCEINNQGG